MTVDVHKLMTLNCHKLTFTYFPCRVSEQNVLKVLPTGIIYIQKTLKPLNLVSLDHLNLFQRRQNLNYWLMFAFYLLSRTHLKKDLQSP